MVIAQIEQQQLKLNKNNDNGDDYEDDYDTDSIIDK